MPQLAGTRPLIRLPASGEVTVGRSAGAQIQLNAAFISRRHARLIAEAGRAYVVPLCRDDKLVTVNGVPAARGARVELRAGDAVSFVKEEADFAYRVERRAPPPANEGQTASGTKRPRAASDGDVEADYDELRVVVDVAKAAKASPRDAAAYEAVSRLAGAGGDDAPARYALSALLDLGLVAKAPADKQTRAVFAWL